MKRNILTVVFILVFFFLMAGGYVLYRDLSRTHAPVALPIDPAQMETEIAEPGKTEETTAQTPVEVTAEPAEEMAPDFSMTDRDGNTVKLSGFRGKPVIVNFWATWCGPCRSELGYFADAYASYGDQIQFVMLDLTDGAYETAESTIRFVEENAYTFPLFFDTQEEGAQAYGLYAIPLTVVIDAEGHLVTTHVGAMSETDLAQLINSILN